MHQRLKKQSLDITHKFASEIIILRPLHVAAAAAAAAASAAADAAAGAAAFGPKPAAGSWNRNRCILSALDT